MQDWAKYLPGTCDLLPPLDNDFLAYAEYQKHSLDSVIINLLCNPMVPSVPLSVLPGVKRQFVWLSGHGIADTDPQRRGPYRRFEVAIVGKNLGSREVNTRRLFAGKAGDWLRRFLSGAGLAEYADIYLTNLLKTLPLQEGKFKAAWVKSQSYFMRVELLLTRPKYVVSFGREVSGWFLGRAVKMGDVEGRWHPITWDLRTDKEEPETEDNVYRFMLLPCTHPAALEYEIKEEDVKRIETTFLTLASVLKADRAAKSGSSELIASGSESAVPSSLELTASSGPRVLAKALPNYPVIYSLSQLRQVMDEGPQLTHKNLVAVDAEWQGKHPQNAGSFLRCVQFGWAPGQACVVHLTNCRGEPDLEGDFGERTKGVQQQAYDIILETFRSKRLRVAGFYFPADLEVLQYNGCDLSPWYEAAETVEACRDEGGFSVDCAVAALDELASGDLDSVRWRFTDYPDYSYHLAEFVKKAIELGELPGGVDYGSGSEGDDGLDDSAAEDQKGFVLTAKAGYGWIPNGVLYPYAGADADVTIRATWTLLKELDADRFGNSCWLPYFNSLGASLTVAEIMRVGLPFDPKACYGLAVGYARVYYDLLRQLRNRLQWPGFNVDSPQQVVEALYGPRYSTSRNALGERQSVRPPGAKTLNLRPLYNNDAKSKQDWAKIEAAGSEDLNTPGTDSKTLATIRNNPEGVLVRRCDYRDGKFKLLRTTKEALPELQLLQDLRAIQQLRKTFVGKFQPVKRRRKSDPVGVWEYTGGLCSFICDDGYLRTFISPHKETGRWSSSRPNLHAIPKRKEARYVAITGKEYPGSVRGAFVAPDGYLILEADYKTAELFMLALAAGDAVLWDHCQRALLPETDPRYIDVHAGVAVRGLRLDCAPTKAGLEAIGKEYLRDAAKCYAAGERIGTEAGWLPIEDIVSAYLPAGKSTMAVELGDLMLQADVGATPLLAVHDAGIKEAFSVRTALGYELRVSAEHEHFVLRDGDVVKVKTKDLTQSDFLLLKPCQYRGGAGRPFAFPCSRLAAKVSQLRAHGTENVAKLLGLFAALNVLATVERNEDYSLVSLRALSPEWRSSGIRNFLQEFGIAWLPTRCRQYATVVGGPFIELLELTRAIDWAGVPDCVFTWSDAARMAFVEGYLLFDSLGSKRFPCLALPVGFDRAGVGQDLLRNLQQLMLSVGLLTHRDGLRLQPTEATGLAWWLSLLHHGSAEYRQGAQVRLSVPQIGQRLAKTAGLTLTVGESVSRKVCFEYLAAAKNRRGGLAVKCVDTYFDRISELLHQQVGFDRVWRVESIGQRQMYDVQTSRERDHAIVCGGIVSSNSIVFGWAYGRGAPAIVIGAKEEGVVIELAHAESVIKSLYETYAVSAEYLDAASQRVHDGYLCTPLGRYRRAPESQDRERLAAYSREFKNAPIQGGVADVVNIAARRLREVRRETQIPFFIANQIHDAFLFLVAVSHVEAFVKYVVREAMSRRVPIIPRRLDGSLRTDLEPKYMECDVTPYKRWGVKMKSGELEALGIDPEVFTIKR